MALIRTMFTAKKQQEVRDTFEKSESQSDVLLALYRMVIPDFDGMVQYNGWPKAGKAINEFIFRLFMRFDSQHHPGVMHGGLWMNNGFSSLDSNHLHPWEVEVNTDEIVYVQSDSKEFVVS